MQDPCTIALRRCRRVRLSEQVILTIDCGTQSLRALLFSDSGVLLAKVQIAYTPYFSTRPGWAEQEPEVYWKSLCQACTRLKKNHRNLFAKISGVGVTTQRNSMINVDRHGKCLRPAILWLDQRKAVPTFASSGPLRWGLRMLALDKLVAGLQAEGKCNWLRQNQPRIWDATFKYLQVSGRRDARGRPRSSMASGWMHPVGAPSVRLFLPAAPCRSFPRGAQSRAGQGFVS